MNLTRLNTMSINVKNEFLLNLSTGIQQTYVYYRIYNIVLQDIGMLWTSIKIMPCKGPNIFALGLCCLNYSHEWEKWFICHIHVECVLYCNILSCIALYHGACRYLWCLTWRDYHCVVTIWRLCRQISVDFINSGVWNFLTTDWRMILYLIH